MELLSLVKWMPFVHLKMNIKRILMLCLCFVLVGCTQTKEEASALVQDYYTLLAEGNIEEANEKFATESFGFNPELLADFQADNFDWNMDVLTKHIVSRIYEQYEIVSVEGWQNEATVKVEVTGIHPEDLNTLDEKSTEQLEKMVDTYIEENQAKLTVLLMKDEEEATRKMFQDLSEPILAMYMQLIDELPVKTSTFTLKLEKSDDAWKIIQLN